MRNRLIDGVEAANMKASIPAFEIGDTVKVGVKIIEGTKERVQPFIGVVIARRGAGMGETFTVRRIVNNEGVERVFPLHSPRIVDVEVTRRGKVRRSKLYYLRDRVGKARKLRERRLSAAKKAALEAAQQEASASAEVVGAARHSDETVAATV